METRTDRLKKAIELYGLALVAAHSEDYWPLDMQDEHSHKKREESLQVASERLERALSIFKEMELELTQAKSPNP